MPPLRFIEARYGGTQRSRSPIAGAASGDVTDAGILGRPDATIRLSHQRESFLVCLGIHEPLEIGCVRFETEGDG
jgi:hypothetical protein